MTLQSRLLPNLHYQWIHQNHVLDINECDEGLTSCDSYTEQCVNTVGSYRCDPITKDCGRGYQYNIYTEKCEGKHYSLTKFYC